MNDTVNHPRYYTAYKGIEVIQLTEQLPFNRGNAVKYVARAGLKSKETEVQDLEKAAWYIQREIARIKEEAK
ncbi:thymidylate kinase [Clavibacter phage CN1A]|uniref:Thymidylate kinase n=1 Tax=Clavibacter phage CN1A TaxID=1406793 RepID=U5PXJ2_9CAUD|nr:thymidylate kinase [Clavibacter phage CN1A]AGY47173.1 thymidylate kinase [Clavibacter phage CN1A]